jgi:hypothetical protein
VKKWLKNGFFQSNEAELNFSVISGGQKIILVKMLSFIGNNMLFYLFFKRIEDALKKMAKHIVLPLEAHACLASFVLG